MNNQQAIKEKPAIKDKPVIKAKQVTNRGEEDYIKAIYKLGSPIISWSLTLPILPKR
jgi:hypothetical protein